MKPLFLIVHHSVTPQNQGLVDAITGINTTHKNRLFPLSTLGFYVGYHYVIGEGWVKQTRNQDEVGAHCNDDGMNFKSIGVCVIGNFEVDTPSEYQIEELKKLLIGLRAQWSIPEENVIRHGDVLGAQTLCCGKNLSKEKIKALWGAPPIDKERIKQEIIALLNKL